MDIILSQLPPWFVASTVILIVVFVVYLVTRSLKEGREISFWPPRIGPRIVDKAEDKNGVCMSSPPEPTVQPSPMPVTPVLGYEISQIMLASEPIGMIRVTSGPTYGLCVFLTKQTRKLSFGRSVADDTSVSIPDAMMSREHFVITITRVSEEVTDSTHYRIQLLDLGSTNGTFVNGKRIQMVDLHNNDRIQAGGSSFRVYIFGK